MGRPLYTTALLARYATGLIRNEPPKPSYPLVEKWSRWNAFDPDSDEFFDSDSAVYEAFLSEEEIAERVQTQQRESSRLLAETLLREAETDTSSASSSTTAESSPPAIGSERISASRPATVQMEIDVQYLPLAGDRNGRAARDSPSNFQENVTTEEQPLRRQPRRSPAMLEWSDEDMTSVPTDVAVPRISVVSVDPVDPTRVPSRSPSPDPLNLVSGLNHLSDSPRPLVPTESPDRAVSPIPNTPARVSGVFATPPSADAMVNTPPPPLTTIHRAPSWRSPASWLQDSSPPLPRVRYIIDSRRPPVPTSLTY